MRIHQQWWSYKEARGGHGHINSRLLYLSVHECKERLSACLCVSVYPLVCPYVCSTFSSRTIRPTDLKFGLCLTNGTSEWSAKSGVVWTQNTKAIVKGSTAAFCRSNCCSPSHILLARCSFGWRKKASCCGVTCTSYHSKELRISHFNDVHVLKSLN